MHLSGFTWRRLDSEENLGGGLQELDSDPGHIGIIWLNPPLNTNKAGSALDSHLQVTLNDDCINYTNSGFKFLALGIFF